MKRKLIVLLVVLFIGSITISNAYVWPTTSKSISSYFGPRRAPTAGASTNHGGIDIGVSYKPCYAVADGTVTYIDRVGSSNAGIHLVIDIGNKTVVRYLHLSKVHVNVGDEVLEGQVVATTGATGIGTGPHLHFEVRTGVNNPKGSIPGTAIDPLKFLGDAPINTSGTTRVSKCEKCGGKIDATFYITEDGKHYRACINNKEHQYDVEEHKFKDGKCTVCKAIKCSACDGTVLDTYYATEDGKHYRVCSKNKDHQYDIAEHKFENGKCTLCDAVKCIKCDGAIVDTYRVTEDGKHYKTCSKDANHQYNIEEHKYENGKCTICETAQIVSTPTPEPTTKVETYTLFKDLPDSHWGCQEIKAMKEAGIVTGDTAGNLAPDEKITAEQFLTLLSQVASKKGLVKSEGTSYIPANMEKNWFYDLYVNLTKALGVGNDKSKKLGEEEIKLILGNTDTDVVTNLKKPITREKVANIMGLFVEDASQTSTNVLNSKDWDQVDSTYKKRINELAERSIFKGSLNPDGTINVNPKAEITKVQAIALISRLYNAL